jgi:hypothetical protein
VELETALLAALVVAVTAGHQVQLILVVEVEVGRLLELVEVVRE